MNFIHLQQSSAIHQHILYTIRVFSCNIHTLAKECLHTGSCTIQPIKSITSAFGAPASPGMIILVIFIYICTLLCTVLNISFIILLQKIKSIEGIHQAYGLYPLQNGSERRVIKTWTTQYRGGAW